VKVRELIERSTAQRAALLAALQPVAQKAAAVDRAVGYVRAYPILSSVVVGAVAVLGPRKILELGTRAAALYALLTVR
jgi:YqjK-like protein